MNTSANNSINESSRSRVRWLIIIGLIIFALIMFRQVLAPSCFLLTTDDNIGQLKVSKDNLPGAFLGNWYDSVYLGMPSGINPVMWNALLNWLVPIRLYINLAHAFDLVLASLCLLLFLRVRNVGWAAIALGFLTTFWLGSNLTLTYAGHIGKYGVLLLASVSLYCLSRALSKRLSLLWSILAGGAVGFMFLEQLDVALFFGLILGAYALFLAIRQGLANGIQPSQPRALLRRSRPWVKSVIALILMGGMILLLAASSMLGSYASNVKGAVSMQTESPQEKWDYVTQWSWPPDESVDFIAPGYMGWRSGEPAGPYWGRMGRSAGWEQTRQGFMNFKLENMYLGIIPILLALFAILTVVGKGKEVSGNEEAGCGKDGVEGVTAERRAEIIFWGCVAGITLLLAFGKFLPLYALFYKLPLVNSIRNPNKFLQVFQLALGILAAYGLDVMLRAAVRGKR